MDENVEKNLSTDNETIDGSRVVKTDLGAKDGQNKCPRCGATEIALSTNSGKLKCLFCRHEFEPEKVSGMVEDINKLEGSVLGSGAQDIIADTNDVLTFKCSSCGAEVVIDTSSATNARCHWCRNTLSVNQQIPNGSIPDEVLPFKVTKEEAKAQIEKFVGKRKFFAHPMFRKEFTSDNVMGVYFPYMLVDLNAHASLKGSGEIETRSYYVGSNDNKQKYYDANLYHVERDFDIAITDLSVESSSDKLDFKNSAKTNNIINSIMPFDTENCVKYNANYLKGYTSEKRDTNISDLKPIVEVQAKDITRFAANDMIKEYDRGVAWDNESLDIKGEQWEAAYLPVWLYSYQQVNGDKKKLHYVAVNARTKETMGSVPIHMPKLFIVSFLVEIIGIIGMLFSDWEYDWSFLTFGILYFIIMYLRYRNSGARHTYEKETKKSTSNIKKVDRFIEERKRLSSSIMDGANNKRLDGQITNKIFDNFSAKSLANKAADQIEQKSMLAGYIRDMERKQDKEN